VAKNGHALTDPHAKAGFAANDLAGVRSLYDC
jgi:hypothetical protein